MFATLTEQIEVVNQVIRDVKRDIVCADDDREQVEWLTERIKVLEDIRTTLTRLQETVRFFVEITKPSHTD